MKKRMNTYGVALSIFIFVIGVAILLTMSIVTYQRAVSQVAHIITFYDYADTLYIKQLQLDYHIQSMVNRAGNTFDGTTEDFIIQMKKELEGLKVNDDYVIEGLIGVDEQLSADTIIIADLNISLTLDLTVKTNKQITPEDHLSVLYTYKKTFEKVFKETIV